MEIFGQPIVEFLLEASLLGGIVFLFYRFLKSAREKGFLTINQLLRDGSISFFHFVGSMSTIIEVVGLAIIAMTAGKMGLYNAFSRYILIGIIELFMTFMTIHIVFYLLKRAMDERSAGGKKVIWWERLFIVAKGLPFWILGFFVTFGIALLYLESKGALVLEFTGNIAPWSFIEITGMSSVQLNNVPQLGALIMIFTTPMLTLIMFSMIIFFSNDHLHKIMEMEHMNDEEADNARHERRERIANSQNNERRSRESASSSNSQESNDDSSSASTENRRESEEDDVSILPSDLIQDLRILDKAFTIGGNSNTNFDPDDVLKFIYLKCGIDPDNPNETLPEDDSRISKVDTQVRDYLRDPSNGIAPHLYFKNEIQPVIQGTISNSNPPVYLGAVGAKELISKQTQIQGELEQARTAKEVAESQLSEAEASNDQNAISRQRQELQDATSEFNRVKAEVDRKDRNIRQSIQVLKSHLQNQLRMKGYSGAA